MKKLLLSLALMFGLVSASAAPITVDFSTNESLLIDQAAELTHVTVDGVDFGFFNCKKTTSYNYVMICGKGNVGNAYMTFTLAEACEKFTITTGSTASTNVTVQLYAGETEIGSAIKLDKQGAEFTFEIPAANQAAGTVYKLLTTNNYNAQVGKIVFNGDGETPVVPPTPGVDISNTPETAYTATKAIELIKAGEGLDTEVYVKGEIKSITEVSTSYGNATYVITDGTSDLTVFRGYYLEGAKFTSEDQISVGQNVVVFGKLMDYNGTPEVASGNKLISIEGEESVAAPTFSVAAGAVYEGTEVAIVCATEGATIYYTVDGTVPTTASAVYSTPIVVNEALTINAFAVKEGMKDSKVVTAAYTIKVVKPITGTTAEFNFADPTALDPYYAEDGEELKADNANMYYDVNGVTFTSNGIDVVNNASGTAPRLYWQSASDAWSYRMYKNSVTTISCQPGYKIVAVEFETQTDNYAKALAGCTFSEGTCADNVLTFAEEKTVTSVDITITATVGLTGLTVTFEGISGIADVEINENAPVEFYNLQGVRVQGDLTPGLYIRRQGNNATKVLVK